MLKNLLTELALVGDGSYGSARRFPEFTDNNSLLSLAKQVVHIPKHRRARVRMESSIRLRAREAGLGSRDVDGRL
jgi:hypothetical protein